MVQVFCPYALQCDHKNVETVIHRYSVLSELLAKFD